MHSNIKVYTERNFISAWLPFIGWILCYSTIPVSAQSCVIQRSLSVHNLVLFNDPCQCSLVLFSDLSVHNLVLFNDPCQCTIMCYSTIPVSAQSCVIQRSLSVHNLVLFNDPCRYTISRVKPLKQSKFRKPPSCTNRAIRPAEQLWEIGTEDSEGHRNTLLTNMFIVQKFAFWKLTNISNNLRHKISQPRFETSIFQVSKMTANHGNVKLLNWSWNLITG